MTDIAKCANAACDPVFQTRGEMEPQDYVDVRASHGGYIKDTELQAELYDPVAATPGVQAGAGNKTDTRIMCRSCGYASGWGPGVAAIPGLTADDTAPMLRAGAIKTWNTLVENKKTRDAMLALLIEHFGEDNIKKHLQRGL